MLSIKIALENVLLNEFLFALWNCLVNVTFFILASLKFEFPFFLDKKLVFGLVINIDIWGVTHKQKTITGNTLFLFNCTSFTWIQVNMT